MTRKESDMLNLPGARYHVLQVSRPDLFKEGSGVRYITDPAEMQRYENETGVKLGVVYQGEYERAVVDLIEKNGKLKTHLRVVMTEPQPGGVVIIVRVGDKFVLEDQYRYPLCQRFLSFCRGHCELNSNSDEDDARREVFEELGGAVVTKAKRLDVTYPETNTDAWCCSVWLCDVDPESIKLNKGFEEIEDLVLMTEDEIMTAIRNGEITCGYTLAAWAKYLAQK